VPDHPAFALNKLSEIEIPYPNVSAPGMLTKPRVSVYTSSMGVQGMRAPCPLPQSVESTTAIVHAPEHCTEAPLPGTGRDFQVLHVPLKNHIYERVVQTQ